MSQAARVVCAIVIALALVSCRGRRTKDPDAENSEQAVAAGRLELVVQRGHAGPIRDVAFSPDGLRILTAGEDHSAKLWDSESGQLLMTLEGHSGGVSAVAFSPDGKYMATGGEDDQVKLWDARTGELTYSVYEGSFTENVMFSDDGTRLVTSAWSQSSTYVRDVKSGDLLAIIRSENSSVLEPPDPSAPPNLGLLLAIYGVGKNVPSTALSPDGKMIASGGLSGQTLVAESATGRVLASLPDPGLIVGFCLGGTRVFTTGSSAAIRLWDPRSGELVMVLDGHAEVVTSADLNLAGTRILTGGADRIVKLWDASSGELLRSFEGLSAAATSVAFDRDGRRILAAGADGVAKLWDAGTGEELATFSGHAGPITSAIFSPDAAKVLTAGADGSARLWDTGSDRSLILGDPSKANSEVAFSPTRDRVALASDRHILLWDLRGGRVVARLAGHASEVTALAFSPDGQLLASGSVDGVVRLWDLRSGQPISTVNAHRFLIMALAFSPDGSRLVTGGMQDVGFSTTESAKLWDVTTGQLVAPLLCHRSEVVSASFSRDGSRILTGDSNGDICVWDATTAQLISVADDHSPVQEARFSPDGARIVATYAPGGPKLWDATTGRLLAKLDARSARPPVPPVFSVDGTRVLTAGLGGAMLWSADGELLRKFATADLTDVAWGPSEAWVVIGSARGHAQVWDARSGRLLAELAAPGQTSVAVAAVPSNPNHPELEGHVIVMAAGEGISMHHLDADAKPVASVLLSAFMRDDGFPSALAATPDGLFVGDDDVFDRLTYRIGDDLGEVVEVDQLFDYFYRPTLLDDFWAGRTLGLHVDVAQGVGKPPRVEILDIPKEPVSSDTIDVRVRAHSRGGGVNKIRLFVNGARVPSTLGGYRVRQAAPGVREQVFTVRLEPGKVNSLRAEAYSEIGRIRSRDARAEVVHDGRATRSELHIVTVSLERYADGMVLDVANDDAMALREALRRQRGRLFDEIHEYPLQDGDATLEGIEAALARVAARAQPQDVFVMFVAGHGALATCSDRRGPPDYLLLSYRASFGSQFKLCRESLTLTRLTELLAAIPSNKKLLIIDACQSGSAATAGSVMAMRGEQENRAIELLARSRGIVIIAGSKDDQSAYEVPGLGHGLFTYALLRGLSGAAAAPGEEFVSVMSLAAYVDRTVFQLAQEFGVEQQAQHSSEGQDFPLFSLRPDDPPLIVATALDGAELAEGNRTKIAAHLQSNTSMILACLGREQAVIVCEVGAAGDVVFRAQGVAPSSPEQLCLRDVIPPLQLEASSGVARIPLWAATTR